MTDVWSMITRYGADGDRVEAHAFKARYIDSPVITRSTRNVSKSDEFRALDALSRARALTDAESIRLENLIKWLGDKLT